MAEKGVEEQVLAMERLRKITRTFSIDEFAAHFLKKNFRKNSKK